MNFDFVITNNHELSNKEEKRMTTQEIIDIIKNKNGRFTSIVWESDQTRKLSAAYKYVNLTKRTKMVARSDIRYENTLEYTRHDHSLPTWQERVEGCNGLVRNKRTGKLYLQIYPSKNKNQIQSQYYLSGEPISREQAEEMFIPSQKNNTIKGDIICIALDDILALQ